MPGFGQPTTKCVVFPIAMSNSLSLAFPIDLGRRNWQVKLGRQRNALNSQLNSRKPVDDRKKRGYNFPLPFGAFTFPARVAKWQTRKTQNLVPARAWRFKSSLAQTNGKSDEFDFPSDKKSRNHQVVGFFVVKQRFSLRGSNEKPLHPS